MNYEGMQCPHCGAQTNIDPALVRDEDPMQYCPECDEPLFGKQEPVQGHSFCERPHGCTMNYCDENGCTERKRYSVELKKQEPVEKPDFETMLLKAAFKSDPFTLERDVLKVSDAECILEELWNDYVLPLQARIAELEGKKP